MSNWYEIVPPEQSLTQGDLLFNCPVPRWNPAPISLEDSSDELEILKASHEFILTDLVVLTQACDLEQGHVTNVTLCPHFSLADFKTDWELKATAANQNPTKGNWEKTCKNLNSGYVWNQTLLNRSDLKELQMDFRVVDFYDVFTLPKSFLESLLKRQNKTRLRLLPPYREHLSQAFARFFMRVGLPTNIALSDLTAITSKTTDDNQA